MFKTQDSRFFPTKSFLHLFVLKKHLLVFRMQENGFDAPQDTKGTMIPPEVLPENKNTPPQSGLSMMCPRKVDKKTEAVFRQEIEAGSRRRIRK
jgi:hypothetical protein